MIPRAHPQSGFTLFMSMVLLIMVTLVVLSAFNVADSNLKIVANMQYQREADGVAMQSINQTISNTKFFDDPASVSNTPITVDVNSDDKADYKATITATCARAANIPISSLNSAVPDDVPCFVSSSAQNTGIVISGGGGGTAGRSLCANTEWDIKAAVEDTALGTGVTSEMHQGVSARIAQSDVNNNPNCN